MWRRVVARVYFTYEATSQAERDNQIGLIYQVQRAGLGEHKTAITDARGLLLPIINTLLSEPVKRPKIKQSDIDNLSEWLKDHDPNTRKVTPRSREIPQSEQEEPMAQVDAPAPDNAG